MIRNKLVHFMNTLYDQLTSNYLPTLFNLPSKICNTLGFWGDFSHSLFSNV